jgi:hypothetical protein
MAFSGAKIMNATPSLGTLTFTVIPVSSKGDSLLNTTKAGKERVGRMMMMYSTTVKKSAKHGLVTSSRGHEKHDNRRHCVLAARSSCPSKQWRSPIL